MEIEVAAEAAASLVSRAVAILSSVGEMEQADRLAAEALRLRPHCAGRGQDPLSIAVDCMTAALALLDSFPEGTMSALWLQHALDIADCRSGRPS